MKRGPLQAWLKDTSIKSWRLIFAVRYVHTTNEVSKTTTETTTKYDDKDVWRHFRFFRWRFGPNLRNKCNSYHSIQRASWKCVSAVLSMLYLYAYGCLVVGVHEWNGRIWGHNPLHSNVVVYFTFSKLLELRLCCSGCALPENAQKAFMFK